MPVLEEVGIPAGYIQTACNVKKFSLAKMPIHCVNIFLV